MTDDATLCRRIIAILKTTIKDLEAVLDAELGPEPKQLTGWEWYAELHAAIPTDWSDRRHFDRGDGWSACGLDFTRVPDGLVGDPRHVWCGRCRQTIRWGNAAIAVLSTPASASTH
jgi:hypothetical protein